MQKKSVKILAFCLAISLIFALSGCKNSQDNNSSDSISSDDIISGDINSGDISSGDEADNNSEQNNNVSENASSSENIQSTTKGKITFATWEEISSETARGKIINDFTKKTGIRVTIKNVTQNTYVEKIAAYKAAGKAPDIIIDNQEWPRTVSLLQPIENGGINPSDSSFDETVVKYGTVNGKAYLVGSKADTRSFVLFYNKAVFKEANVPNPGDLVAANNWNLDTFTQIAKKIHDFNSNYIGATVSTSGFTNTYGAGFIKYDPNTSQFRNATGDAAFSDTWYIINTGIKAGYLSSGMDATGLVKGTTAMACVDITGLEKVGYFESMKLSDLGFTFMPKKSNSDSSYPLGGLVFGYGIADGAANPLAAGEFLKYYLDPANIEKYSGSKYLNAEAEKFAKELMSMTIPTENIIAGKGPVALTADAVIDKWDNEMESYDPSQIEVGIGKLNNRINNAVNKANEVLSSVK